MSDTIKYKIDYPWRTFGRDVMGFIGKNRRQFAWATILAISCELAWLYFPIGLGEVVNFLSNYQTGQSLRPLITTFVLLALVSIWRAVGRRLTSWLGYVTASRAYNNAYHRGIRKLLQLGAGWHASENSGNKVKRVQKGASSVERTLRMYTKNFLPVLVAIPGAVIVIAQTDYKIAFGLTLFAVIYFVSSRYVVTKGSSYSQAVNQQEEHLSGLTFETVNNIRVVQVGALSTSLLARIKQSLHDVLDFTQKRIFVFQIMGMGPHIFANLSRLGLMGYTVYGVINGQYELGLVLVVLGYFNAIWNATEQVTDLATEFLIARYGVWRLRHILQASDYIVDTDNATAFPADWQKLSINNVSFVYEDGQETLENVNLEINKGQKIGVVGSSGAGKSTLFKLLTRERTPSDGSITIDDVSISDIQFQSYFANIGVMLQETELFSFTLKENVTLAAGEINEDRFARAIKIARVSDFVEKLPYGVDTIIGEKGFKLSGGERQRVGIARAIYHQPQIIFFDEATSHLDVESEKKIQAALEDLFETTTALVIAHRLSTIQEMDRILVMEGGKIVEEGSFQELLDAKGRFYDLWQQQQL